MSDYYSIKIAGEAGMGIKSTGQSLYKYLNSLGYYIYNYLEYPSLIRGGHNVSQIIFSPNHIRSPRVVDHALIALDQNSLNLHSKEIIEDGFIIHDSESEFTIPSNTKATPISIPIKKLGRESEVGDIGQNIVALGCLVYLFGGGLAFLDEQIKRQFSKKPNLIEPNQRALQLGFDYAAKNFTKFQKAIFTSQNQDNKNIVVDGNEAIGLGAISGGLDFSAIYPMSPISNLLHFLAKSKEKYGFIYKQVEDEIAAINMCIGASFAGARVLTATSGGGFSLMSEAVGLAGITETPIVIVEGMRGGPATGLPTWSEQGDLRFVMHAHQGEFPRIVLTPGDNKEAFLSTHLALNLAAKYQCPVIVLVDKNICDHPQSQFIDNQNLPIEYGEIVTNQVENYLRYQDSTTGISPRSFPGHGNFFVANSDEHDEKGFSSEEIIDRNTQHSKRMRKLDRYDPKDLLNPVLYGPRAADLTLVGWGSTKGPVLDALQYLPNTNFVHIPQVLPFPTDSLTKLLLESKRLIDIENNSTAQMAGVIREYTGIQIKEKILKNDGRPFFPEEIINRINTSLIT